MRIFRFILFSCFTLFAFFPPTLRAENTDHEWHKTYILSGEPSLLLDVADTGVEIQSCGECRQIQVDLQLNNRKLSDYSLEESQSGNTVAFKLKEKVHVGIHVVFHMAHEPHLIIKTPSRLHLDAHTGDGSITASGLQGDLTLHTSDGSIDIYDVAGTLRLNSSDGNIRIHNANGVLEARTSDGHLNVDGRFSSLQVHTSDGNLDLTLSEGSQLTAASRVESSDGRVTVHLPHSLSADLDIHTSDGKIDCSLPLTMEGYHSHGSSQHDIRGKLNAGGPLLVIHTSDGNVTVASL